jgi:hypothetical protein
MTETIALHPQPRGRMKSSVLESHTADYCEYLREHRYAFNTQRVYVCCVAHFARWITLSRIALPEVDEQIVDRFTGEHLAECTCPYPVRRCRYENNAALRHLLRVLRQSKAIPAAQSVNIPVEAELLDFHNYMDQICGLAVNTRNQRTGIVRKFLSQQFGSRPIAVTQIAAVDVRRFALDGFQKRSAGTIRVIAGAMRCYFRLRSRDLSTR